MAPPKNSTRPGYKLGIRNHQTLQLIKESTYPLAELHLQLMFADSDWKRYLTIMNNNIGYHNREQLQKNPRYREIHLFTPRKFITCHRLLIGVAAVLKHGIHLWPKKQDIDYMNEDAWTTIVRPTDFGEYIPFNRFKVFKRFVPTIWEDSVLLMNNDPWYKFATAVESFNNHQKKFILTSSTRVLDESMCAYRPRTSKFGGLPNISDVMRKPEPLGTKLKTAVCP